MKIQIPEILKREKDIGKKVDGIVNYLYRLVRELENTFQCLDEKNMNSAFLEEEREKNRLPVGNIILRQEGRKNAGMSYGTWSVVKRVQIEGESFLMYRRNQ